MKPSLKQLSIAWLVGAAFGLTVLGMFLGSGCTAGTRQTVIRDTFTGVDGARIAYVGYDLDHQKAILAAAPDKATFEKQIAAYRATQGKIVEAFNVAYRALAAAAIVNTDQSLSSLAQAAADLYQALKDAGIKIP